MSNRGCVVDSDYRFRTAPGPSDPRVDSYTGLRWCGAWRHLMTEENTGKGRRCLACEARKTRTRRASK